VAEQPEEGENTVASSFVVTGAAVVFIADQS
jgi:hypothetical protein